MLDPRREDDRSVIYSLAILTGVALSSLEAWRPVPGYESLYAVSDRGRVRSLRKGGALLVGDYDAKGYRRVKLCRDGEIKCGKVHRLVCHAFHGDPPPGHEAGHLNGNPADNRADNLRWITRAENARQRIMHGRIPVGTPRPGEAHPGSRLTEDQVRQMRELASEGMSRRSIGREFGISASHAHRIITGERWKHSALRTEPVPVSALREPAANARTRQ